MTELILARHGETDWNVAEVFRGRADIGLNGTGVKQAELLAEYLSSVRVDAIYSSPLKRALRTAEVIARYQESRVEVAPGLIDFDYGEWQGLSHQEVKDTYKGLYGQWVNNPHEVEMPSGESLDDVSKRAIGVVDSAVARGEGTVVMVSHRVVNKVLICALLGLSNAHFWQVKQDTAAITTFSYRDGRFILSQHNNTSYLAPIKQAPLGDF
ncbi:MAG: histidine phosphatase family protein [Chloroflexota bacterium]